MKKLFLSALGALAPGLTAFADEGMWLLPYLQKTNYADMKAAGLKLKATDIYNPDGPSLKDAIIIFGLSHGMDLFQVNDKLFAENLDTLC